MDPKRQKQIRDLYQTLRSKRAVARRLAIDVKTVRAVLAEDPSDGLGEDLHRVGEGDLVGPGGRMEPLDVLAQPEDRRRAVPLPVGADPLEDAGPVVQRVGEDMRGRVGEGNQLAARDS